MDIFKLHSNIMQDYRSYIESFINIKDKDISEAVEKDIASGKLWPDPLIQFNPAYETYGKIDELIDDGTLHEGIKDVFTGYNLYRHQVEAIRLGATKKDFIVTSGTGSGKSLTYLGTIFNYLLKNPSVPSGVKAIIIYPMNALVNSQTEEILKYKENYTKETGKKFPITFGQYTGQEEQQKREEMKSNPPDVLLTNYMMLELLLSRSSDRKIKKSIYDNLQFLTFDELHTYRGRQGADVAMLIRRIKSKCINDITCIGTSATMISGGSIERQKQAVSEVASTLFGQKFTTDQVINEYLASSFGQNQQLPTKDMLCRSVSDSIDIHASEDELKMNPTALWLEKRVALKTVGGNIVRETPMSLLGIVKRLTEDTGLSYIMCRDHLKTLLQWISNVNLELTKQKKRYTYIPFKLHQFISQTGSVHITLDQPNERNVTLEPGVFIGGGEKKKPLFPVVFSRTSGHTFVCVSKNPEAGKLIPREFTSSSENEDSKNDGYLIIGDNVWDPIDDMESMPDSWIKVDSQGNASPQKKYKDRFPQKIYFDAQGNYSRKKTEELGQHAWFMSKKLLFDPTSGTFYAAQTSEGTKLAQLGGEGRSTSTTITSFSVLKRMAESGFNPEEQKLLSFTDNRQDAALQSGHFNDYINVIRLRSSIYRAMMKNPNTPITHATLGNAIFEVLNKALHISQWSNLESVPKGKTTLEKYQNAFKTYLTYRALYDLRRGWRVILPNLEQCGMLKISYDNLEENAADENIWSEIILLNQMPADKRYEFLIQVLEFYRLSYALSSEEYLTDDAINRNCAEIKECLREPWKFEADEQVQKPYFLAYTPVKSNNKLYTASIGEQSRLGKYIKSVAKKYNTDGLLKGEGYCHFIKLLMDTLASESYLKSFPARDKNNNEIKIYQLNIVNLQWNAGDKISTPADHVTNRSYKTFEQKPNLFFQRVYDLDFSKMKNLSAGDHTGQLTNDDRKDREAKFRTGDLSVMYCSPTMELGIDIASLNIVHMRNAPPNSANYAQRSGRAGRSGQAALVLTYCSSYSSHDRHYFAHAPEMVAGAVTAPRLDLCNEELLRSHLHATVISEIGIEELKNSIADIVSLDEFPELPIYDEVKEKLKLSSLQFDSIKNIFRRVLYDFKEQLERPEFSWFNDNWIEITLNNFGLSFDSSLNRWRTLYQIADDLQDDAQKKKRRGRLKSGSKEYKEQQSRENQAVRQLELLRNEIGFGSLSEFYPYRYLASEGFLPGYNFTRLPLRTFIPKGDGGEYISRPRSTALREFGPGNRIYHSGKKYSIKQLVVQDAENCLEKAKVCKSSGYLLMGNDFDKDVCPFTGVSIQDNSEKEILFDLIEMKDSSCAEMNRITCEEEERISQGFVIDTFFKVENMDNVVKGNIKIDDEELIHLRYIPAMRLIQVNEKWRTSSEKGFPLGLTTGFWKKAGFDRERASETIRNVKLYTTMTADALYIEPTEPLALDFNGVITLQYALKKAIENRFQVESSEIGVTNLGGESSPNILIYESVEGSLGVLSQFTQDPKIFHEVINEAIKICRFDDEEYEEPASYNDLLSYYNQRFHQDIDRFLIEDALNKLKVATVEIVNNSNYDDYDLHYESIRKASDPNSSTEAKFIKYLYDNSLKLPDAAQKMVEGIYVQPDYFYEPNIHVFCDGTPHDNPEIMDNDDAVRQQLISRGDQVIVYYYKDNLPELINSRPDIFKKVR